MLVAGVVLATLLSYPLGLALGWRVLLPLLNALPAYTAMVILLRRGRRSEAVRVMWVWALCLAVFGTIAFSVWPRPVDDMVIHGPEYRREMFEWILTGVGAEGDLRRFLPQHLGHLAAFVALSLASASAASIFMGAVLMNYMDFYVASLGRAGAPLWAVVFLGWQPWAICRVAAFCVLGCVLAEPMWSRIARYPYGGLGESRRWLLVAAGGILADWILKALLAPTWGRLLRPLIS